MEKLACSCDTPDADETRELSVFPYDGGKGADGAPKPAGPAVAGVQLAPHELGLWARVSRGGKQVGPMLLAAPPGPIPVQGAIVSGASAAVAAYLLERCESGTLPGRALELGAGRGLVGLALARLGAAVEITDLEPEVCRALTLSAEHAAAEQVGQPPSVRELDWDDGLDSWALVTPGLIVGAELLWADDAVDALWEAVCEPVLERACEFVYGSSMRPSNAQLLRRLEAAEGCEFSSSSWLIRRCCKRCDGWLTLEECTVTSWRRADRER